jgi:multicomponent Na+:H+ antiporter subunit B
MAITAIGLLRVRNLFAVVMLTGLYSLLAAVMFVLLDAVDVAFTEAAVGAGIATILMLGTLALTTSDQKRQKRGSVWALGAVLVTGVLLIYGTLDMPYFGDASAPIHLHVVPHYMNRSGEEIGIPNVVTSVLASYRGYDTLGETTVIFTAAMGVLGLLGRGRRKSERGEGRRFRPQPRE